MRLSQSRVATISDWSQDIQYNQILRRDSWDYLTPLYSHTSLSRKRFLQITRMSFHDIAIVSFFRWLSQPYRRYIHVKKSLNDIVKSPEKEMSHVDPELPANNGVSKWEERLYVIILRGLVLSWKDDSFNFYQ